jgi:hypothetical protein
MKIISFVGFIGCGKNTTSNFLTDHGYRQFAFADSLKDVVASIFCWPRDMVEGNTSESREWREKVDSYWSQKLSIPNFTPRFALQNIGTEIMRKYFNENIWLYNVEKRILNLGDDAKVVITDARFFNELAMTRDLGGKVFRVKRGPDPEWVDLATEANRGCAVSQFMMGDRYPHVHKSEWSWVGYGFDDIIENDGSLDNLRDTTERLAL